MTSIQAYWMERLAETREDALNAVNLRHREIYIRLIETYASLAGWRLESANDNLGWVKCLDELPQKLGERFTA